MTRTSLAALGGVALAGLAAWAFVPDANAQRIDPRRPSVLVVGAPRGAAPMARVDGRRSGSTRDPLPSGRLRVAWKRTFGLAVEQPALVTPDGSIALVTARGDVVFLDPKDGEERGQVTVGAGAVGPAVVTSDGTVVFMTSTGDAVGVRRGSARPRFTTRIGGERNLRAAPLALDDGGAVVATSTDLAVLDGEGGVRTRVTLAEAPSAPLVASGDRILAVGPTGSIHAWVPGREPVRVGSFGGTLDGAAALTETGALVAVVDGVQIVDVDLARGGARTTRALAPAGLYLGPPAVRPGRVTLLALAPSRTFVVALDGAGQETLRASVAATSSTSLPDGGVAPLVAPPHTGVLVDARGAVAFAAPDGHVGVVAPDGSTDTIGELICSRSGRSAGVAGLTPTGPAAFVVTCEAGSAVLVAGSEADRGTRPGR